MTSPKAPWYERLDAWAKSPPKERALTTPMSERHAAPLAWHDRLGDAVGASPTSFEGVRLQGDRISHRSQSQPVAGVTAVVESAGELQRRATLTRTVAGGLVFGPAGAVVGALFKKKVDTRELYLLIDGERFAWAVKLNPKRGAAARRFAATVNTAARQ